MTLESICSDLLPLTRGYRTNLISEFLRSISCTFDTYMLFAKQKYIIGNTCAHIFTDREGFVYVHPMQSKSQAREALNVATRNIGFLDTLLSDNAREQTGPHT